MAMISVRRAWSRPHLSSSHVGTVGLRQHEGALEELEDAVPSFAAPGHRVTWRTVSWRDPTQNVALLLEIDKNQWRLIMTNLFCVTRNMWRVLLVVAVATAAPAGAQEFTVILESLQNPPVCDLLLGLDTTGDCLHGLSSSLGQAVECIEDPAIPAEDCPALSWAVPGDKAFYSHTSGIGVTDYDAADLDSCPNNCSASCIQGGLCAVHCCTSVLGDEEDGLDFSYAGGIPSEEEIRVFVGKPVKISDVWLWSGSMAEFVFGRSECPPIRVSYREGDFALRRRRELHVSRRRSVPAPESESGL